jgi:uncharacterized integral membrane protein
MSLRTWSIVVGMALLAAFALQNWVAFTAPTQLSLGFAMVEAPLGLVMLAVTAVLSGLFLVYIVMQQAGVILEARRYAKEMKGQRELADKAEASRFTELREYLTRRLDTIEARADADAREAGERVAHLERQMTAKLDEATRSLSAYVGEVDDKLDRLQLVHRP